MHENVLLYEQKLAYGAFRGFTSLLWGHNESTNYYAIESESYQFFVMYLVDHEKTSKYIHIRPSNPLGWRNAESERAKER